MSEPTCTWSGQLPVKMHRNPAYSCKVFLGGVPWDITEGKDLVYSCKVFLGGVPWDITEGKEPSVLLQGVLRRCAMGHH